MKISVIIPVVNEEPTIECAVARAWESGPDQVVVVDGGSVDGTIQLVKNLDCQLVESSPGRAVQMNEGSKASDADVFVFLHADNSLTQNACNQIRIALENEAVDFGCFRQQIQNTKRIYRWIEFGNIRRVIWQGLIYGDQALFIRRGLFEQVGGFPVMPLMEDFELSRRLRKRGKPFLLPGPTIVSARRWEKSGPLRQTVRNWILSSAYRLGVSPAWIARRYRRHDQHEQSPRRIRRR